MPVSFWLRPRAVRLCQDDKGDLFASSSLRPGRCAFRVLSPHESRFWVLFSAKTLALLVLCGCSGVPIRAKDGTVHHLIIGIGVVSVNQSRPTAATVTSSRAVGLSASDRPSLALGLGYSSQTITLVPGGAEDVQIETSQRPFGPLRVKVGSAELQEKGTDYESTSQ